MIIIHPENKQAWLEERTKDITSTEIAALFGISPYLTEYELWHRKKNNLIVEIEENERMKWGKILEDSIAKGVAEEQGWTIRRMYEYGRIPELRIGSSFDFSIIEKVPSNGDVPVEPMGSSVNGSRETGLLEIKNVDGLQFKKGWIVDGDNVEAPPHIELQVQHQLLVSGRAYAYIGALIGGNNLILIKREPSPKIHEAIKQKAAEFWKSIDDNTPPPPNFQTDSSLITSLYNYSEPGKVVDVAENEQIVKMAVEYKEAGDKIKVLDNMRDEIKAKILTVIGDAEKALGGNFTVTANMVGPAHIEYERKPYRSFKITWKKGA